MTKDEQPTRATGIFPACGEDETLAYFCTMSTSRNLGLAAISVFVASFFLPAYGNESGFACFGHCCDILLGRDLLGTNILSGIWFYYGGFVVSNVLFVGLVAALFVRQQRRKLPLAVSVIVLLHVLSWFVGNVISGNSSQIFEFKIGFHAWLVAYALLVAAHFLEKPAESLQSIPPASLAA